jgi:hypothetical protein
MNTDSMKAFCICKILSKAQLISIAMPIDCWKTCSSAYANVNSSTKSLGKIVIFDLQTTTESLTYLSH